VPPPECTIRAAVPNLPCGPKRHGKSAWQGDFQINFTVTKNNYSEVSNIFDLAERVGARALHFFFLVPTGRGQEEDQISPERQEELLLQIDRERGQRGIEVQVTCAPQYARLASLKRAEAEVAVWRARILSSSPGRAMSIHAAIFQCSSGTSGPGFYRYLGEFARASGASGGETRRKVRPMQFRQDLRRLPGAGLCQDGQLPGIGPVLPPGV